MGNEVRALVIGPLGFGVHSQAESVAQRLQLPLASAGEILRSSVSERTPLGLELQKRMEAGQTVSDDLVCRIITDRLSASDYSGGWVMEGFPRNIRQARLLSDVLHEKGERLSMVLYTSAPDRASTYKRHLHNREPRTDTSSIRQRLRADEARFRDLMIFYREMLLPIETHFSSSSD